MRWPFIASAVLNNYANSHSDSYEGMLMFRIIQILILVDSIIREIRRQFGILLILLYPLVVGCGDGVAPEIYAAECQRVSDRFTEAVTIAESTFAEELSSLVSHLAERLSGEADGKPKVFRDTAVTNLTEFLERFQRLSIGTDESLEQLMAQARCLVTGIVPEDLRQRETLRQRISSGLTRIEASLDGYMTDRPRRNIIRRPAS